MLKLLLVGLMCTAMLGCAHQKLKKLEYGMSHFEVEKLLGTPENIDLHPEDLRMAYSYTMTNDALQRVRVAVFFDTDNNLIHWQEMSRQNINLAPLQAWAHGMSQPTNYSAPAPQYAQPQNNNRVCGLKPPSRHGCDSVCINGDWKRVCKEYSGGCGSRPPVRSNCAAQCVDGTWEIGCY